MTPNDLIDALRDLDRELHSTRVTTFYRSQDDESRARFVGLRGYVAQALADALHAQLDELATALQQHDAELSEGLADLKRAVRGLNDAVKTLNILGDVLTALSKVVPGVLDHVL